MSNVVSKSHCNVLSATNSSVEHRKNTVPILSLHRQKRILPQAFQGRVSRNYRDNILIYPFRKFGPSTRSGADLLHIYYVDLISPPKTEALFLPPFDDHIPHRQQNAPGQQSMSMFNKSKACHFYKKINAIKQYLLKMI